ncbi:MAG: SRPBCC domain-containing protein [Bacteroidetes bacterium]|nr:SRPBCC domain-containing protein [Bacteroidota bacterium]
MAFTNSIQHDIHINAPASVIWKALTQPEFIKLWLWESEVEIISEWKAGSSMIFKGTFHNESYIDKGLIIEMKSEEQFSYWYWSHLSQLPDSIENYQKITFKLEAEGEKTKLYLDCHNLINEAIYGHWNFYWIMTLGILKKVVEAY